MFQTSCGAHSYPHFLDPRRALTVGNLWIPLVLALFGWFQFSVDILSDYKMIQIFQVVYRYGCCLKHYLVRYYCTF